MEVFSLQIDFCIRINVKGNISDVKSGKKGKTFRAKSCCAGLIFDPIFAKFTCRGFKKEQNYQRTQ